MGRQRGHKYLNKDEFASTSQRSSPRNYETRRTTLPCGQGALRARLTQRLALRKEGMDAVAKIKEKFMENMK